MKKKEVDPAVDLWVRERYDLVTARVKDILSGCTAQGEFRDYFEKLAEFIIKVDDLYLSRQNGSYDLLSADELKLENHELYKDILKENYDNSYANPAYAVQKLGKEFGQLLSWLVTEIRRMIAYAFQGRLEEMTAAIELFVEIYNRFEEEMPQSGEIKDIIYWYVSDYSDLHTAVSIRQILDPTLSFYKDIIMESNLNDLSYLYRFGTYISESEIQTASYLNSLDQSVIDDMADTFVNGFVRGFEVYRISLEGKKNVQLRANVGFERVSRSVIRKFASLGLDTIISQSGYQPLPANPQYAYDHKNDRGLYLDKALCERIAGVHKTTFEEYKEEAKVLAGPTLMEVFGDEPFEPVAKPENVQLSDKQKQMTVSLNGKCSEIRNKYIDASTISFAIISWPIPAIGERFEEIFADTIKVNNLDNDIYREIQQYMIDAMDGAEYVHVKGMNGNTTDIRISLYQLSDPEKETVFENCCADVNIPVGEVFTSPVLKNTNGILNVSSVYLNGLNYKNLTLEFKDGLIDSYDCDNYEDAEENRKFLIQNLLQNHETLPMGEFAIGTNTTAYTMARKYGIGAMLPILIMEKTGPHFAVGDTCYSHIEDIKVYNQDGKEIVARANEKSELRKTDPENAYFNVHTDITIPYDEVGLIAAVFADGREMKIIENGIFVLKGTEKLNDAL